jgi:hypothetical protein
VHMCITHTLAYNTTRRPGHGKQAPVAFGEVKGVIVLVGCSHLRACLSAATRRLMRAPPSFSVSCPFATLA